MTVLIVEDIDHVRQGIASLLLDRYDMQVLVAINGEQGLEMILRYKPQLVLTDVKMPICDGIQMMEQMHAADIRTPVIVISGYAEFEYAERAINMGARGYILKPIDEKVLYQKIDIILEEQMQTTEFEEIRRREHRLESQRYSQQIAAQVTDHLLGKGQPLERKKLLELIRQADSTCFTLLLINIDARYYEYSPFTSEDLEILKYGIGNVADEVFAPEQHTLLQHNEQQQQLLLLLQGDSPEHLAAAAYMSGTKLVAQVKQHLKILISVGVGLPQQELCPELYRQARQALQQRLGNNNTGLYLFDAQPDQPVALPEHVFSLLAIAIKNHDDSAAQAAIETIFCDGVETSDIMRYIRQSAMRITELLTQEFGNGWHSLVDLDFFSEEALNRYHDLTQVRSSVASMVEHVFKISCSASDLMDVVQQVRQYLEENYSSSISVRELAHQFGISYPYLCVQFKSVNGKSIIQYITELRMQMAAKMLQSNCAEITQIAEQVGYPDLQYFYRIFKKHYGVTPMAYRSGKN